MTADMRSSRTNICNLHAAADRTAALRVDQIDRLDLEWEAS